jgi:hypothetical protein
MSITVEDVERAIDLAFADNRLKDAGYAQAVWTLLSVNEDQYLSALLRSFINEAINASSTTCLE